MFEKVVCRKTHTYFQRVSVKTFNRSNWGLKMNDDGIFFLQSMYFKAEEAVILFIHSSQTHESGQVVTL